MKHMIKLIATDMDDTLLDEHSEIPEEFNLILEKLIERKVRVVIASGRPYNTLKSVFGTMADKLSYICDNGALVVHNNEIVYRSIIENEIVNEIVKCARANKNNVTILNAFDSGYIENTEKRHYNFLKNFYVNLTVVDDLTKLNKEVDKVSIYSEKDTISNFNIIAPKFGEMLFVVRSGDIWVDMTNRGINKGVGIRKIVDAENIMRDEVMAFGDYYNDIEMLREAEYSFVMENSPEDMRQYGNYIAESNREHGVLKAISKYVLV